MADRIRFPTDPAIQETGSGQAPQIPLNPAIAKTTVEMLNEDKPEEKPATKAARKPPPSDDDDENTEEESAPEYAREQVGARIGLPLEASQAASDVEQQLDTEDCVPCLFPTHVKLQDAGIMHTWAPGLHVVPVSLAGIPGDKSKPMHWWLRRNKVRRAATQTIPNPNAKPEGSDD